MGVKEAVERLTNQVGWDGRWGDSDTIRYTFLGLFEDPRRVQPRPVLVPTTEVEWRWQCARGGGPVEAQPAVRPKSRVHRTVPVPPRVSLAPGATRMVRVCMPAEVPGCTAPGTTF